MHHVANVATTKRPPRRHHSFLKLHPEELHVLGALDGWMFKLFCALVMMADFRSGQGSAEYWQLISACSPIQPSNGGPRRYVPSQRCVRDALLRLERARVLRRQTNASEREGELLYRVASRVGNFALR
jgi:hypothetical protein